MFCHPLSAHVPEGVTNGGVIVGGDFMLNVFFPVLHMLCVYGEDDPVRWEGFVDSGKLLGSLARVSYSTRSIFGGQTKIC